MDKKMRAAPSNRHLLRELGRYRERIEQLGQTNGGGSLCLKQLQKLRIENIQNKIKLFS